MTPMTPYVPFFVILGLGIILIFSFGSSIARKRKDYEVAWLKRGRRLSIPDNSFHIPLHDLQLCVSCEEVHLSDQCPKCGSQITMPLIRIVRSTRGLEFPIRKDKWAGNVIELPVANRSSS